MNEKYRYTLEILVNSTEDTVRNFLPLFYISNARLLYIHGFASDVTTFWIECVFEVEKKGMRRIVEAIKRLQNVEEIVCKEQHCSEDIPYFD